MTWVDRLGLVGSTGEVTDGLPCTDAGNGDRLLARHASDLYYVWEWRESGWCTWDGERWLLRDPQHVRELTKAIAAEIHDEAFRAQKAGLIDRADALGRWAVQSQNVNRVSSAMVSAGSDPRVRIGADDWDPVPFLLGVPGGVVDLRSGDRRAPQRADLITKQTGVPYDPEARCPEFERCLEEWLPDPELRAFVQVLLGQALVGEVREHVFPVFHGEGANGKSTLIEAVRAVAGDYVHVAPTSLLMDTSRIGGGPTPELADLHGRRLVYVSETKEGRLNESQMKALTGGDTMTAHHKYERPFEFSPTWTLVLVTNIRPDVQEISEATIRRLRLVPFEVIIPADRRDPGLKDRLVAQEGPGILAWLVAGAVRYHESGLPDAAKVREATAEYVAEEDVVGRWIEARCDRVDGHQVASSELHSDFRRWCENEGTPSKDVLSTKTFGRRLTGLRVGTGKGTGGTRVRVGLRLRPVREGMDW